MAPTTLIAILYAAVYVGGFASLIYLTHENPMSVATPLVLFGFPVALVVIGAVATRVEQGLPATTESAPTTSLLGREIPRIRPTPWPASTLIALTMLTPHVNLVFPASWWMGDVRVAFVCWWYMCAAFVGFVVPRLVPLRER